MYKLNSDTNELIELDKTTFKENNLLERNHIEEWIRKNPEVLGEELLIIGHEYDKFDTNDRLDLLALDKEGKLVIIELKRDKSGSNVDFQSLKYCSYCSQLTPQDILELFTEYLKTQKDNSDPQDVITDFLELSQGNEDSINEILNNSQRFIIVGKEIDRRILSVCAWLHENGIEAKCLTIKPFMNESKEIYIDFDQIIPPYKIGDYYIQKKESKSNRKAIFQPEYIVDYFEKIVEIVEDKTTLKINYSPRKAYCNIRTGGKISYTLRYFKRDKSFSIHALVKDTKLKEKLSDFNIKYAEELSKVMDYKVEYQEEGARNPNWSYLRVIVETNKDKKLSERSEEMAELFIRFCEFVNNKWK